ncbi:MAG: glycosyltransferase [Dysgonamonadaceae bacterium]|nr:glycosyltransferase [Dysgonamonadaceae bacterium]
MKHWRKYLSIQKKEYMQSALPIDFKADAVVVIPCFNEPALNITLTDILEKSTTEEKLLVVVVINSSVLTSESIVEKNRQTYLRTQEFAFVNSTPSVKIVPIIVEGLPRKHAGVGLARKIGMDLAIDYFLRIDNPEGIIISLDADCTISGNYFPNIINTFKTDKKISVVILNFDHRVEEGDLLLERAILQYESYIRYFENTLKCTGFPYYYHTIGSAFAVSADAYVQVGGMGRQQGGEDFYFLQKVFQMGSVKELPDVFVYPLARYSDRIPFGTGPALRKIIEDPENEMTVYSVDSFIVLKTLFDMKDTFFRQSEEFIQSNIGQMHPSIKDFLIEIHFVEDINDCNSNSATLVTFQKRFFHHFNAFKVIKFLNYVHPKYFELQSLSSSLVRFSAIDW